MVKSKTEKKLLAAAISKRDAIKRNNCFDPFKIESEPSPKQRPPLEDRRHLHTYLIAGNQSGKSTIGARRVSWLFLETDPYWERPNKNYCNLCKSKNIEIIHVEKDGITIATENFQCLECKHKWVDWGNEPLLIVVAGRISQQVDKLWETKIKHYLPKGSYKNPKRPGGILQEVVNAKNGNTIIFTSHDKADLAAEKVQSYVAHFVWLDEMPNSYKYIEELHRRCDSKRAQFLATFTPKSRNEKVRAMVDNVDPEIGVHYRMGKLDNPIYWGREQEERAKIAHLPLEEQLTILEGAWQGAEEKVFHLSKDRHIERLPKDYSRDWAHVISVDPAVSGKAGMVLAARDPNTKYWWIVQARYIDGKAPSDLVQQVEKIAKPYNIVKRIYDPASAGFFKEAVKAGIKDYVGVYHKSKRKKEIITNLQQALKDGWLKFNVHLFDAYSELNDAEWNSDETGIKRSTKYHILDSLQYFIDNVPSKPKEVVTLTRDQRIMKQAREQRIANENASKWSKAFNSRRKRVRSFGNKPLRNNIGI